MSQPDWRVVYATDYSKLETDATGVYPPELTIGQQEGSRWIVYRIVCDPCFLTAGVLSDNPFHKDMPAWFASDIRQIAENSSMSEAEFIEALCSEDASKRARAYEDIGAYFGYFEFDQYPLTETEAEFTERLSSGQWIGQEGSNGHADN